MSSYIHPIALQKQVQPKLSALRFRRQELQEQLENAQGGSRKIELELCVLGARIRALEMAMPNDEVERVREALT